MRADAQADKEVGAAARQLQNGVTVQMVVMVMRDHHSINALKLRQRDWWWMHALGPGELEWRGTLRQHRVTSVVAKFKCSLSGFSCNLFNCAERVRASPSVCFVEPSWRD